MDNKDLIIQKMQELIDHYWHYHDCSRCHEIKMEIAKIQLKDGAESSQSTEKMDTKDEIIKKQDELMSCPFCGCVAIIIEPYHKGKHNGWHLYCNGCHLGYTQLVIHNTLEWLREKMISKWNTRAYKSIAELSRLPKYGTEPRKSNN